MRLEFVAMNLKKLAKWKEKRQRSALFPPLSIYLSILHFAACFSLDRPFFDSLGAGPEGPALFEFYCLPAKNVI